jgi:predicted nucleic acid-binding protein
LIAEAVMLLDTSGLFCFHHRDEPRSDDAQTYFEAAGPKLTHSYVLAEFVALAMARGLPRHDTLLFLVDLLAHPEVEVVWVAQTLYQEAIRFLKTRLDKSYSLCDAVSFLLMRQRGLQEALTTDRHFEQEGFRRLLG